MARPKGSKNRRTLLREAEKHVGDKYTDVVLDSLYVIECSMRHFFLRAEMRKHTDEKPDLIDADYEKAGPMPGMALSSATVRGQAALAEGRGSSYHLR
jgi:hypothetical protein